MKSSTVLTIFFFLLARVAFGQQRDTSSQIFVSPGWESVAECETVYFWYSLSQEKLFVSYGETPYMIGNGEKVSIFTTFSFSLTDPLIPEDAELMLSWKKDEEKPMIIK